MIIDNVLLALESLKLNKFRSFLTMLGIIIGIGSVIIVNTVGSSLTGYVSDSMSSLGGYSITVSLTQKSSDESENNNTKVRKFMNDTPSENDLISDEMIEEYKTAFESDIKYIQKTCSVGTATYNDSSLTVLGTDDEYEKSEEINLLCGRYINNSTDGERKLAVVSDYFVKNSLNMTSDNAIGTKFQVTINDVPYDFYIVGVYEYESETLESSTDTDDEEVTPMYIPLALSQTISSSGNGYQSFSVITQNDTDVESFMNLTGDFFASYYTNNDTWSVTASSASEMISTVTSMINTISYAVSAIAAISLLVGGIGVMNIMLVSISERTKEIGTRKALGAQNSSILLQFVTESAVICLIGGTLGVALGIIGGVAISKALGYSASVNALAVVGAVAFSAAIGIIFGLAPAKKASNLDPIDALRYE